VPPQKVEKKKTAALSRKRQRQRQRRPKTKTTRAGKVAKNNVQNNNKQVEGGQEPWGRAKIHR